ncbi:MAG: SCP2 sterol-binding domain-containing protein [Candidatus Helarchaeales archaeon]
MDLFKGPTDMFGMALYNGISSKMEKDERYRKFISKLRENILVELDYYPILLKFEGNSFEVTREIKEKASVIMKINIQDFMDILDGKSSIISTFLKGKMKFKKGLTKILKVYRLFSNMIN